MLENTRRIVTQHENVTHNEHRQFKFRSHVRLLVGSSFWTSRQGRDPESTLFECVSKMDPDVRQEDVINESVGRHTEHQPGQKAARSAPRSSAISFATSSGPSSSSFPSNSSAVAACASDSLTARQLRTLARWLSRSIGTPHEPGGRSQVSLNVVPSRIVTVTATCILRVSRERVGSRVSSIL